MPPPSPSGSPGEMRYAPMPSGEMKGEYHPPEMLGRPVEQRMNQQEGMNRSGEGYQSGGEFRQEQKPYPSSEAEVRGRVTEDMTKRMTEQMTQQMTEKIRNKYKGQEGSRQLSPDEMRRMEGQYQQGRPFEGGGFMPPSQGGGQPFQGGEFHPPSQGGGQPFEGGGFGPGGGEGFGGPQGGFGGSWGPGGEGGEFDEGMMEEQERMMKKQQLEQMKRGFRGMESGIKQMQKMIDRLLKKGVAVPQEYVSLISEITQAVATVKNAEEFDESVEAAMEVLQEKGPELGDIGPRLGMLEQMSQMTKQLEKQFAQLDKALAKAKKRKEASQFPAVVVKVEGQIDSLKQRWAEVKQGVLSGDADPEDLREVMEGIFEEVGDVHRSIEMIRQLGSISKMLRSANKEIATFEKQIARQRKAGKDVSRLDELLVQGKAKLAEVKAFTEQGGFEPEELFDLMQELEKIGNEAHDELERISGAAEAKAQGASVIQSLQSRRQGL